MGRKPRQEPLKEYLENPRTTWLFSSPQDYTEVFPQGDKATSEMYLKPATKGTRLGKGTYRIVLHLPNKHHNDRAEYMKTLEMVAMVAILRVARFKPLAFVLIRVHSHRLNWFSTPKRASVSISF